MLILLFLQSKSFYSNCIGGVIVSMFALNVVDRGCNLRSNQPKDCTISICCFSTEDTAAMSKSKDWFVRNQNNVSAWSDMSTGDICSSDLAI